MKELIIVGAGPAGMTAGVYAARKGMDFLMVAKDVGGQAALSADVENYLGYQFVTGWELAAKFREHLEGFGIELHEGETVTLVEPRNGGFLVETDKGSYRAKTVIVASGRIPRKLGVQGEDRFRNRGLTYCATCDAPLFQGLEVAVIGGGNAGLDAVLQLLKVATKIYLIEIGPELRADPVMVEKASKSGKVEVLTETRVQAIHGKDQVEGLEVERKGETFTLPVKGIFVEIGSVPASDFVRGVEKNPAGEIVVNCRCETSLAGLFAAGDVTDVFAKQIIVACGEGAKAALAAFEYLSRRA